MVPSICAPVSVSGGCRELTLYVKSDTSDWFETNVLDALTTSGLSPPSSCTGSYAAGSHRSARPVMWNSWRNMELSTGAWSPSCTSSEP